MKNTLNNLKGFTTLGAVSIVAITTAFTLLAMQNRTLLTVEQQNLDRAEKEMKDVSEAAGEMASALLATGALPVDGLFEAQGNSYAFETRSLGFHRKTPGADPRITAKIQPPRNFIANQDKFLNPESQYSESMIEFPPQTDPKYVYANVKTSYLLKGVQKTVFSPVRIRVPDSAGENAPDEPVPTIDLKVNGSDGPISGIDGTDLQITWTSTEMLNCSLSPMGWTGLTGNAPFPVPKSAMEIVLTCLSNKGQTYTDSVTIAFCHWKALLGKQSLGAHAYTCPGGSHVSGLCFSDKTGGCPAGVPVGATDNINAYGGVLCCSGDLGYTETASSCSNWKPVASGSNDTCADGTLATGACISSGAYGCTDSIYSAPKPPPMPAAGGQGAAWVGGGLNCCANAPSGVQLKNQDTDSCEWKAVPWNQAGKCDPGSYVAGACFIASDKGCAPNQIPTSNNNFLDPIAGGIKCCRPL